MNKTSRIPNSGLAYACSICGRRFPRMYQLPKTPEGPGDIVCGPEGYCRGDAPPTHDYESGNESDAEDRAVSQNPYQCAACGMPKGSSVHT